MKILNINMSQNYYLIIMEDGSEGETKITLIPTQDFPKATQTDC